MCFNAIVSSVLAVVTVRAKAPSGTVKKTVKVTVVKAKKLKRFKSISAQKHMYLNEGDSAKISRCATARKCV